MQSITDPHSDPETPKQQASAPWLEELLTAVNYNFPKEITVFCVTCQNGMHVKGDLENQHKYHTKLDTYAINDSVCVRKANLIKLGVDVAGIQVVPHSSLDYIYLHNIHGYTSEPTGWICVQCKSPLIFAEKTTRYCCLECKYDILKGRISRSRESSPRLPIASISVPKPEKEVQPSYKDVIKMDTTSPTKSPSAESHSNGSLDTSTQNGQTSATAERIVSGTESTTSQDASSNSKVTD